MMSRYYERVWAAAGVEYEMQPRGAAHPLHVRSGTSDIFVLQQVFVDHGYGCLDTIPDVGLVIDCGANVGYTSAYLLSAFPACRVIAVEPDAANFAMLQRNLAAYGERVLLIQGAVWSHATPLIMSREAYRGGGAWTKQVAPCEPGQTPELDGVDIASLLARSRYDRISILKIDIEGAEAVLFSANYEQWLDKVDAIAVELHDDSAFGNASAAFARAIKGKRLEVSTFGELTVCRRSVDGGGR